MLINDVNGPWRFTGFYGHPERNRRRLSWGLLRQLAGINNLPWVCMGDFNDLLSLEDKKGGAPHPNWLFNGFREAISDCSLLDVPLTGHQFTWSNGRGVNYLVEERLDRVMGSPSWHSHFPYARLQNLVSPISDHSPIMLETSPGTRIQKVRAFRFENQWLDEPSLKRVVEKSWTGFRDFPLLERIKATSGVLSDWGKHISLARINNRKDVEAEIERLRTIDSEDARSRLVEARQHLARLLTQEETYWRQRAKAFWLTGGDLNTRFFHQIASARKKTNSITGLLNDQQIWVTEQHDLNKVVSDYFSNLFEASENMGDIDIVTSTITSRVTESENDLLVQPFEAEEFRIAISQMHKDMAPGPDGFNPAFYKKFWTSVGSDIVDSCIQWLDSGSFSEGLNNTNVTLIPKCEHPKTVKDLRPISLCNVVYKILSKVLCNRLKKVLTGLIDESQSAFQSGRSIQDNIIIAFESLHGIRNRRRGMVEEVALKIDISKAYDRVDWRYLEGVLRRMIFSERWITWMKLCVQTVSYTFLVNDARVGPIKPSRRLRQGDPLSPYLFILCAEGLSSLLRRETIRGSIHGCRVHRRAPTVSHLLFADDCLIFCRATEAECVAMKDLLNLYERASGQAINYGKSGVFYSPNVDPLKRATLNDLLGFHLPLDTGKYLGLPSLIGRSKSAIFRYLRERLWSKLTLWRGKKLSKAGKEILIKSAAQSIPAYCMSTFLLPSTLIDELHRMMNSFWWGNTADPKKGVKWESWESLCRHKNEGGMGFRNLHLFNIAMLGKLVWRFQTKPNSLVARILKAKYFPRNDLFHAQLGTNPSYVWRSICTAKDLVIAGTRWKIGDGTAVRVWGDPWLDRDYSLRISTPAVPTFEDMVVNDLFIPGTRTWDKEVIMEAFSAEDSACIMRTTIAPYTSEDRQVWHYSPNGVYTVKSAYHLAVNIVGESGTNMDSPWKAIWRFKVPPRVRAFYWRLCKGWLVVRVKLRKWYASTDVICPLCNKMPETIWHLFVDCDFARECWTEGNLWTKINAACYEVDGQEALFLRLSRVLDCEEMERAMMITWAVWRARNDVVWNESPSRPSQVIFAASIFLAEWKAARPIAGAAEVSVLCRKWHPPRWGFVKINVDASFFEDSLETGVGMIIHDDIGEFVCCRSLVNSGVMKVDEGEAWGVVEAIRWAVRLGFDRVMVESDSKRVVDALSTTAGGESVLCDYIDEGRRILADQRFYSVSWVNRGANMLAHSIARTSRDFDSPHCWVEPPSFVEGLLDRCAVCA